MAGKAPKCFTGQRYNVGVPVTHSIESKRPESTTAGHPAQVQMPTAIIQLVIKFSQSVAARNTKLREVLRDGEQRMRCPW